MCKYLKCDQAGYWKSDWLCNFRVSSKEQIEGKVYFIDLNLKTAMNTWLMKHALWLVRNGVGVTHLEKRAFFYSSFCEPIKIHYAVFFFQNIVIEGPLCKIQPAECRPLLLPFFKSVSECNGACHVPVM